MEQLFPFLPILLTTQKQNSPYLLVHFLFRSQSLFQKQPHSKRAHVIINKDHQKKSRLCYLIFVVAKKQSLTFHSFSSYYCCTRWGSNHFCEHSKAFAEGTCLLFFIHILIHTCFNAQVHLSYIKSVREKLNNKKSEQIFKACICKLLYQSCYTEDFRKVILKKILM